METLRQVISSRRETAFALWIPLRDDATRSRGVRGGHRNIFTQRRRDAKVLINANNTVPECPKGISRELFKIKFSLLKDLSIQFSLCENHSRTNSFILLLIKIKPPPRLCVPKKHLRNSSPQLRACK